MSIMRPPQYPLLGLLPADVPQNFGYVIDAAQRHRRCAETGACTGQIFSRTSFQLFVTAERGRRAEANERFPPARDPSHYRTCHRLHPHAPLT